MLLVFLKLGKLLQLILLTTNFLMSSLIFEFLCVTSENHFSEEEEEIVKDNNHLDDQMLNTGTL